jgi:hypothetical protein
MNLEGHTMRTPITAPAVLAAAALLLAACGSSGEGGREVEITQTDDGCTPASVSVTRGEKLKLVVTNQASKDSEVEGEQGTKLEEVLIPKGKTRTPGYTVPDSAETQHIKCYIPGGPATIIELVPR